MLDQSLLNLSNFCRLFKFLTLWIDCFYRNSRRLSAIDNWSFIVNSSGNVNSLINMNSALDVALFFSRNSFTDSWSSSSYRYWEIENESMNIMIMNAKWSIWKWKWSDSSAFQRLINTILAQYTSDFIQERHLRFVKLILIPNDIIYINIGFLVVG